MSCSYNEVNYTNKTLTLYFIQHFSNNVKQRLVVPFHLFGVGFVLCTCCLWSRYMYQRVFFITMSVTECEVSNYFCNISP